MLKKLLTRATLALTFCTAIAPTSTAQLLDPATIERGARTSYAMSLLEDLESSNMAFAPQMLWTSYERDPEPQISIANATCRALRSGVSASTIVDALAGSTEEVLISRRVANPDIQARLIAGSIVKASIAYCSFLL